MAQAVLLPALGQMILDGAAQVMGVGRAAVARLQSRFRRRKVTAEPIGRRSWQVRPGTIGAYAAQDVRFFAPE